MISEADIILIAVNTPTKRRGIGAGKATDVTALEAVTREIAIHARPGAILVEKSTVPCRTAEIIRDTVSRLPKHNRSRANLYLQLEIYRPNTSFTILSNPEFLSAGTAISDLVCQPTQSGERAAELLKSVYSWVPDSNILTTNTYSSELAKLVANSMLAQRISSINSISAICEQTGADVGELSKAVGLDDRIGGKYLQAGIGFGGSCFGKDIRSLIYLAEGLHLPEVAEYWEQVLKINEWQRTRFVRRVVRCLNGTLAGKKIAVLGYAFKKGTDDTRESPALESIRTLLEDAPHEVAVFDPFCNPEVVREEIGRLVGVDCLRENGGPVVVCGNADDACMASHAVIIMTDCDEFRNALSSSPKSRAKHSEDPRPFHALEPRESDLLDLHKYLVSSTQSGKSLYTFPGHSFTDLRAADPLMRFVEEPECDPGCTSCLSESKEARHAQGVQKERLDWAKIAYHLQKPR
jgi:UDPglucose 6-dehydrogenase